MGDIYPGLKYYIGGGRRGKMAAGGAGGTACRTRKKCAGCGQIFRCRSNRQRWCEDCGKKRRREIRAARRKRKAERDPASAAAKRPRPPRPPKEKECPLCGRVFPARGHRIYCLQCTPEARRARQRERARRWRSKRKAGRNAFI